MMTFAATALDRNYSRQVISAPLSLQNQLVRIGGQMIVLPPSLEGLSEYQDFSHDDVFGPLEAHLGTDAVKAANQWVADALYPESKDSPTLAVLRLRAGFSQRALAEKIDVKQPYIARLESGSENPTFSTMKKLAKALDMSVSDIALALEAKQGVVANGT